MNLDVHFYCPCGAAVEESIETPKYDHDGECRTDESWHVVICDACGKDFEAHVSNASSSSQVKVDIDGAVDVALDVPQTMEEDDVSWMIESNKQLDEFVEVMQGVVGLVKTEVPNEARRTRNNMLFVQAVAAVEAYLSSVFIHTVLNSDDLIRRLVESDPSLAKQKFSLKEIFSEWEGLRLKVARHLKDLIFHDLTRVKPMFREVLGVEFEDISWLFRAVMVRHDCVHRNGFDKSGVRIDISEQMVLDVVDKASRFVNRVDEQLVEMGVT